jgi:hypothetical protein
MFCSVLVTPLAGAATTILFVEPTAGETISDVVEVEVKIDNLPDGVALYIDNVCHSDMTYAGYDGTYWGFTYSLNTWGLKDGPHNLRVDVRDGVTVDSSGLTFFVDNYAPEIRDLVVKYPEGQEAAKKGDFLTILARISDPVTGVASAFTDGENLQAFENLPMYDDGKHNDTIEGDGIYGTDPFKVNALTNGYNLAFVSAIDGKGNSAITSVPVAMDNNAPIVRSKVVQYPVGQIAAKEGDEIQVVAEVEDTGPGGMLRIGTDIVLVLDNSGSMINPTPPPMDDLKAAVNHFVNMSHPEDRIAIFGFSDEDGNSEDAYMYMGFTPMNEDGKQQVKDLLQSNWEFNSAHNTPIWDTIGEGIKYAASSSIHQPVVVAITDGTDYGYDWYERPDPDWWKNSFEMGYYGIGFERGSEDYAPWNSWGTTVKYTTHYGEYPAPWVYDDEVHFFDAPIDDTNVFSYTGNPGDEEDRDVSDGLRMGLLDAPMPVFTIGLGVPHHTPIMANTTEYDLYMIAETSSVEEITGRYYYAPTSSDLNDIYEEISFFINLAGDINVTPPGGIKRIVLDTWEIGQPINKPMYDDGLHDDVLEGDETFGTGMMSVRSDRTEYTNLTLHAEDIVGHKVKEKIEVLVDNTPPTLEGLKAHLVDPGSGEELNRKYAMDGDLVYFTLAAGDFGEVSGLRNVLLDASAIGADEEVEFRDDGNGKDKKAWDGIFTSDYLAIVTGGWNGFVMVEASATDIANNEAIIFGSVLMQNSGELMGQLVQPQDNETLSLSTEIKLLVNDNTNIDHIKLVLEDEAGQEVRRILMGYDSAQGYYHTVINTTELQDGYYTFYGIMTSIAGYEVETLPVRGLVDNHPPSIYVLVPKNGEVLLNMTRMMVQVKDIVSGSIGMENIRSVEFDLDGQGYLPMTMSLEMDTWETWLDPDKMSDGVHEIFIKAIDRAGHVKVHNITFYMDTSPPDVSPVYVPSTDKTISGEFKFAFAAEDASGIVSGVMIIGQNKSSFKMVRNPATGLYEYNMDTTQQNDGKRNYCVVFTDKAGRETQYCSSYKVDNSNIEIIEPDPTIKIIKERDIWPWILVAILVIISCVIAVFVVRERYLRKAQEREAELLASKTKKDEGEEGPPSTPLPDDGPIIAPGPTEEKAPKDVKVDIEGRKRTRKATYQLSTLEPATVRTVKARTDQTATGTMEDLDGDEHKDEPKKKRKGPRRFVKCPMCMSKIPVRSKERPLVLTCKTCGAKGKLK